jgi:monoterpene epsilon-lactone hydrolase
MGPTLRRYRKEGVQMTISPAEHKIRASFPLIRFLQAYIPLPVSRWMLKRTRGSIQHEAGMQSEQVSADGVACEWIIPQNTWRDQVLLYLHGGGFVLGLTVQHFHMVGYLAKKMAVRSLMVDYRLAPEYPFPGALDDCVATYHWLLKQGIAAHNIVLAGDSAGGNLTITSLMKLRDNGDPLPAAAACLSPVTDLTNKESLQPGFKDPILPDRAIRFYNQAYVGQNDPHNPLISPVYGDLHGLPPLLVHAGEDELLREDGMRITERAKSAGVEARLEIYPRMWHVWQLYLELPQAVQSLEDIAGFLRGHVGRVPQKVNEVV